MTFGIPLKTSMIKVAVIDDSKASRERLKSIIDLSADFQCVCVCETGEEALKMLPKHSPAVVLMDIALPGISGIECMRRLKRLLPEVLVVINTVCDDPQQIFGALRAGASGYILKSSLTEEVMSAVREVGRGGGPMSGEIARKVIGYFNAQSRTEDRIATLTSREKSVLDLLGEGFTNKQIADHLSVSVDAVRWHLKHIYVKLRVHSRTEAALKSSGSRQLTAATDPVIPWEGWQPLATVG
jgi:DNA-binding NarL/FixJ family response regulator